jgi:hypothetical protein
MIVRVYFVQLFHNLFLLIILIYIYILTDNFGQVTCFDNFSNQKHKIVNLIDNQRYACSKNSNVPQAVSNWKKYNVYGTGHAVTTNGDAFMAIALSF